MTRFIGENPQRILLTNVNNAVPFLVHRIVYESADSERLILDFSDDANHEQGFSLSNDGKQLVARARVSDLLAFDQNFKGQKLLINFEDRGGQVRLDITVSEA